MVEPVAHNCLDVGSSPTTPTNFIPKRPSDDILEYIRTYYTTSDGKLFSHRTGETVEIGHYIPDKNRYEVSVSDTKGSLIKIKRFHIIWFLEHGEWPTEEIDHIDRNPCNDSIFNLRMVSRNLQSANSEYRGKRKDKNDRGIYRVSRGWQVQLWKHGKRYIAGYYMDKEEARKAFRAKYLELWGVPYD